MVAILGGITAASAPGFADDGAVLHYPPLVSELRLGLLYHEDSRFKRLLSNQNKKREGGFFDVNVEILFARPNWHFDNRIIGIMMNPRLRAGGSINTGSGTNQASIGLVWDTYLTQTIFLEGTLGIAIHDGYTGKTPVPGKRRLGCNPLARQSLSLGMDIDRHWRVMLTAEHIENFEICGQNSGLTNLGGRIGYKF